MREINSALGPRWRVSPSMHRIARNAMRADNNIETPFEISIPLPAVPRKIARGFFSVATSELA